MDVHQNARLTPHRRALLVDRVMGGLAKRSVAAEFGITVKTLDKWVDRYRSEGPQGLQDRSSRPHHSPPRPRASWSWQPELDPAKKGAAQECQRTLRDLLSLQLQVWAHQLEVLSEPPLVVANGAFNTQRSFHASNPAMFALGQ
jgi:transposase-like protein